MGHVVEPGDGTAVLDLAEQNHDAGIGGHQLQQVPRQVKVHCLQDERIQILYMYMCTSGAMEMGAKVSCVCVCVLERASHNVEDELRGGHRGYDLIGDITELHHIHKRVVVVGQVLHDVLLHTADGSDVRLVLGRKGGGEREGGREGGRE